MSAVLNVRAQKLLRDSQARRGMPKLPAGTTVYVIPFSNKKYFTYGYMNKETANKVRARLTCADLDFNSVSEVRAISQLKPEEV
jgi:hypothetical protein